MPKWVTKLVYYGTFKRLDGSLDGWYVIHLKKRWIFGIRDLRKTLLRNSAAVQNGWYIDGLRLGGRFWL